LNFHKIYNFHPILFGIFPALSLFSTNISEVMVTGLTEVLIVIGVLSAFAAVLWITLKLVIKNTQKSALITSIIVVMIFLYGHIESFLTELIVNQLILILPWFIIFSAMIYLIIRTKKKLNELTTIVFVISLVLVIIPLGNVVSYGFERSGDDLTLLSNIESNEKSMIETLPDIYYIIFDRYANADTLQREYNFDNSNFLIYLNQKGFYIASDSTSNYDHTPHSLASSLNMLYLDFLAKDKIGQEKAESKIFEMIEYCKICDFFKSKGYKYIFFGNWWAPTVKNSLADININYFENRLPNFSLLLYETTILYPLNYDVISSPTGFIGGEEFLETEEFRLEQWKRILYQFDKLNEIPSMKEPTFVFAHFLLPHDPYVFDEKGQFVSKKDLTKYSFEELYLNQLSFTNEKIKNFVEKVIEESEIPPIIILQADEGPIPKRLGNSYKWEELTAEEKLTKTKIFNAYYLPGFDIEKLYPEITPVNTFRIILDNYFGMELGLLPDHSYAETGGSPLIFINTTDNT